MRDLTVGYDRIPLIKNINLGVRPGEILTLIGPNGSGKSTILKTITKQLKTIGGSVFLGKESMRELTDSEISRHLSMVMTERIHTELLSGRDVVATGRYPYTGRLGILSQQDWKKVDEAIALVHAGEVQQQDFRRISDGQRQRLMLARAICQDTQVLILDEPTSYLDMGFKLDILTTIRMLARKKNLAVIMSLHELDLAQKISDTIACVKGDRIDRVGTPEEIFSGNYVQQLYGVKPQQFEPQTGQVFMERPEGIPEVFVIGGGGTGLAVYNRLQRQNIPFAAGILQENDVEYAAASALAACVFSEKAFFPVSEETFLRAKQMLDDCDACICALTEFGPYNEKNRQLYKYAKKLGKVCAEI
ncbi:ABC transporter ATP-binding protein [Roseburia faecis]|uniref:ABC transporter ATP-binding protein n=1 Tax=Roseburia faecis TaxID=301302 RepID=UPI001D011569|nr:ABC transporter ATP-binding protein [Roseburia faecis]MCB5479508.1 ABC transporter ATP-binding protein [Roseburia faecis]